MITPPLSSAMTQVVMSHLGVTIAPPTLSSLQSLVNAYIRKVPWETVSRLVKRAGAAETADCPRWPNEFWADNMERGCGGTCFESNYAFFSLLCALGYEGYLTVNNMGDSIGCHSAILLDLVGMKWLVDAGYPLFAVIPLNPYGTMQRATPFMHYTVRPKGENVYQVEQRPHPNTNAFTLIDRPVPDAEYRAVTTADYGRDGRFLNRIIVSKIVDEVVWRFNSDERPWRLTRFQDGIRKDVMVKGDAAVAIARKFKLDESMVQAAFECLALTQS